MTGTEPEILIPAPLDHQLPIVESAARFKVVRAGRRGGKTVLAEGCGVVGHGPTDPVSGDPMFKAIVHDMDVVWVARDYTQAGIMWHEFIRPRFKGVPGVRVNEGDRTVTLEGAGTLFVISAENIASARGMGKRLAGMIVEEAAWLDLQTALRDVILPALMDNEGWLLLISTTNAGPDGNPDKETPSYFNRICEEIRAGERSADWAEFHFTAEDNPKITQAAFDTLVAEYPKGSPSLEQEVFARLLRGGVGMAIEGLREDVHIIPRQPIPDHWPQFGAFDWGYSHPFVFGWFANDEDGNVVLVDTVKGRKMQPDQLAAEVEKAIPVRKLRYIAGGHDLKNDLKSRGETGPTLKERFSARGWKIIDATISRVSGLNNLRLYAEWTPGNDQHPMIPPRFRIMDTPTNREVFKRLSLMQIDPDKMEDALKVDADAAGNGGDDEYDMVRYGLMSRPITAKAMQMAPEADRAPKIDWAHGGKVKRVNAEQEIDRMLSTDAKILQRRSIGRPRW